MEAVHTGIARTHLVDLEEGIHLGACCCLGQVDLGSGEDGDNRAYEGPGSLSHVAVATVPCHSLESSTAGWLPCTGDAGAKGTTTAPRVVFPRGVSRESLCISSPLLVTRTGGTLLQGVLPQCGSMGNSRARKDSLNGDQPKHRHGLDPK
jgi:hypothetical protein